MGLIFDLYENFRKTKTNEKSSKPKERHYDYDGGFTGKRIDCPVYKPNNKAETDNNKKDDGKDKEER